MLTQCGKVMLYNNRLGKPADGLEGDGGDPSFRRFSLVIILAAVVLIYLDGHNNGNADGVGSQLSYGGVYLDDLYPSAGNDGLDIDQLEDWEKIDLGEFGKGEEFPNIPVAAISADDNLGAKDDVLSIELPAFLEDVAVVQNDSGKEDYIDPMSGKEVGVVSVEVSPEVNQVAKENKEKDLGEPEDIAFLKEIESNVDKRDDRWQETSVVVDDFIGADPSKAAFYYRGEPDTKLSKDTKDFLHKIPAGVLPLTERALTPRASVEISRGELRDPFAGSEYSDDIPGIGKELELEVSVREPDTSRLDNLAFGREAFISGQYESAIVYYKKVLKESPENKNALFGLAATYQKTGELDSARNVYLDLLEIDQNNWPALNNFLILASQESPEDALDELKRLQKYNPEFAPIPQNIGLIYIRQGRTKEAAKYLTRSVILAPENLGYRYNLAVLLDHIGEKQRAYNLYLQLINANGEGKRLPVAMASIKDRMEMISGN